MACVEIWWPLIGQFTLRGFAAEARWRRITAGNLRANWASRLRQSTAIDASRLSLYF